MAKISPVSIKYMIHANFEVEGALEKPDVIGAIFGQTEGLLGAELEMRELQKEGKIGRIEVDLERSDKRTTGKIMIPTALDQSETTLIAAAIETIERIGPCDSQIEVEKIEDVRGSKRDYIIERAKKLMQNIDGSTDSRIISNEIKDSAKIAEIQEYGKSKLPAGNLSEKEIIVVEGRADVLNLMRNNVNNVIAMNGTKLPEEIKELSKEKEITLFVDGDRGGKLIVKNVVDNAEIKYIAIAPDGKEVEELTGKEILLNLRKKVPAEDFLGKGKSSKSSIESEKEEAIEFNKEIKDKIKKIELNKHSKEKIQKIYSNMKKSNNVILLDENFNEIKKTPLRNLGRELRNKEQNTSILIINGTVTKSVIKSAEETGIQIIAAKNFSTADTSIQLLSL